MVIPDTGHVGAARRIITSRRIAAVTLLLLIASIWGLIAVLKAYGPTTWALPAYLAVVAVIGITGMVLAWRMRHR